MRTEPPRQAFSATPQYAPHYEPDAQAWSPQPHHGFYGPNPDPWMQQQGYATPSVAYPGLHMPAYVLAHTCSGHASNPLLHLDGQIMPHTVMLWQTSYG